MRISDDEVARLKVFIDEEIPDLKVVYKEDKGWMFTNVMTLVIWSFFAVVGAVEWFGRKALWTLKGWEPVGNYLETDTLRQTFNKSFSNGLNGNTFVFPTRQEYEDWSVPSVYRIVRHELIHVLDQREHPIWFSISYPFLLPVVFTMRAYWEMRGYTGTMIAYYDILGRVPDPVLDWIEDQFTGMMYFWMWPFPKKVRARLEEIREKVYNREITGYYF